MPYPWICRSGRLLAGLFLALALAVVVAAAAQAQQKRIIVAYEEFPLYSSTNSDGVAEGFSIDMIKQLAGQAGYQAEFVAAQNPARALKLIETGEADATTLLALTEERLRRGLPTFETGSFELRAFSLRGRGFASPEDLAGLRIGVVAGSYAASGAREIPFSDIVEFPETDDLIVPLLTGEVDAVVTAQNVFLSRLRNAGVAAQVATLSPALSTAPFGFIISKNRADLQVALNTAIKTSLSAGDVALLRERWFGRPAHFTDRPGFWMTAGVLLISVATVGLMAFRLLQQRAEAARLLKTNAANDLLVAALDEMNAAIVIYDRDMRAIHSNSGFAKCFPSIVPDLSAGLKMDALITQSYRNGAIETDMDAAEIEELGSSIVADARHGTSKTRTVRASNGQVYDARDFRLGQNHYASIRVDITNQYAQQETIRRQAASLQKANEQLQTFSNIAAHDLRAPLRHISTLIEFAAEDLEEAGVAVPVPVARHFSRLKAQSARMTQLVEDLLIYAQAGTSVGQPQQFNPIERLRRAVALVANTGDFDVRLPKSMPDIHIDPTAFEAVMRNLIGNAIKHHDRPKGTVRVHSKSREGFVDLCVTDDGAGIPEEYREMIFQPFKRLSAGAEGSGLGLAYIKETVTEWGGEVSVASAVPRGTTFTVSIPKSSGGKLH